MCYMVVIHEYNKKLYLTGNKQVLFGQGLWDMLKQKCNIDVWAIKIYIRIIFSAFQKIKVFRKTSQAWGNNTEQSKRCISSFFMLYQTKYSAFQWITMVTWDRYQMCLVSRLSPYAGLFLSYIAEPIHIYISLLHWNDGSLEVNLDHGYSVIGNANKWGQ